MLYEFDERFHTRVQSPICHVYWQYKTCIGGRSYPSSTDSLLDFHKNKTEQLSTNVNLLGLDETSRVVYNSGETQTCHFVLLFPRDIDSGEIPASAW